MRDLPRAWNSGAPPAILPLPVLRGSPTCIANGEDYVAGVPDDDYLQGFPLTCYQAAPDLAYAFFSNVASCPTQLFFARLIGLLYDDEVLKALNLIRTVAGPLAGVTFHEATLSLPAVCTIIGPATPSRS